MKTNKRKFLVVSVLIGLAFLGGAAAMYAGVYNVAADDPHMSSVSVVTNALRLARSTVPDLQLPHARHAEPVRGASSH